MDKTIKMKLEDGLLTGVGAVLAVIVKIPVPEFLISWASRISEWLTVEGMPILQGIIGAILVQIGKELSREIGKGVVRKYFKKDKKDGKD